MVPHTQNVILNTSNVTPNTLIVIPNTHTVTPNTHTVILNTLIVTPNTRTVILNLFQDLKTQQQMLKQVQHDKGQAQHDRLEQHDEQREHDRGEQHEKPVQHDRGEQHEKREHDIQPRFRFPKGSRCKIYNLPVLNLLKEGEELWIAEGCSDCWALLSSGKKAVAIPSATLLNVKDIEVLKGLNLHMYPDSDIPGEKLFLQLKTYCPGIVRHSLPEGFKDFSEWYMSSRTK